MLRRGIAPFCGCAAGLVRLLLCLADLLSCAHLGSAVTLAVVLVAATVLAAISTADLVDLMLCLVGLLGWPVLAVLCSLPAEGLP